MAPSTTAIRDLERAQNSPCGRRTNPGGPEELRRTRRPHSRCGGPGCHCTTEAHGGSRSRPDCRHHRRPVGVPRRKDPVPTTARRSRAGQVVVQGHRSRGVAGRTRPMWDFELADNPVGDLKGIFIRSQTTARAAKKVENYERPRSKKPNPTMIIEPDAVDVRSDPSDQGLSTNPSLRHPHARSDRPTADYFDEKTGQI